MPKQTLLALVLLCSGNAYSPLAMAADEGVGRLNWQRDGISKTGEKPRSCATCHGSDLTQAGQHIRTGKRIKPMSVRINPERLTDSKKVAKWFKRNCKWTWGRECTAPEKADFIAYLNSSNL